MIARNEFGVRNILIYSLIPVLIYCLFSISKWFIVMTIRNRRIFKLLRHYRTPPYLPILGHALHLRGTPPEIHKRIFRLASEYGPNFYGWMFDKVYVIVGKPEDLQKVLTSQTCLEKNAVYHFSKPLVGEGIFTAPVEKWRRIRKILNPTFNTKVLNGYQATFSSCASIFVNEVLPKNLRDDKIDWFSKFMVLNMDIAMKTSMGVDEDVQRKPVEFGKWLEECSRVMFIRACQVLYHADFIFYKTKIGKSLIENSQKLLNYTDKIIQERKRKFLEDIKNDDYESFQDDDTKTSTRDRVFLDCLLELDHRGMKFTQQDLKDEVNTFFIGATDTMSATECFFLTMMGIHQDIQDKVYEEAKLVLDTDQPLDLSRLEYLDRCLREAMRLFPAGPILIRDNKGEDLPISDGVIPKDTSIIISPFYTHRCELFWKDPLKFNPDRFLPDQVAQRNPYAFLGFSGGPRGCIGQKFAYQSMKTSMSLLLTEYRVHCDAYKCVEDIEVQSLLILKPVNGFRFWLEKRQSTE